MGCQASAERLTCSRVDILILGEIFAISPKRQQGQRAVETGERTVISAPGRVCGLCNASYGDTTKRASVDDESLVMAEFTLDVPDELVQRLKSLQDRLPELLTLLVGVIPSKANTAPLSGAYVTETPLAYAEVLDFLLTHPTPQDIIAFKVSDAAQARIRFLLDKNREETLSARELAELDVYEQLEHLMILLKAKSHTITSRQ
jgi:hypothetical protein